MFFLLKPSLTIITLLYPCHTVPNIRLAAFSCGHGHALRRGQIPEQAVHSVAVVGHADRDWWVVTSISGGRNSGFGRQDICEENLEVQLEVTDHNFRARYLHGNIQKQKGIINMHLNIRSLRFKVAEVKQLIKNHNPHIFGISESELKKEEVEENTLKIPGYDILFPKSWSQHGYARVVVYVKKTFKYQQIADLEDDHVQSVWLKGGQRNCKEIFFCHSYREHLSKEGSAAQHNYLNN